MKNPLFSLAAVLLLAAAAGAQPQPPSDLPANQPAPAGNSERRPTSSAAQVAFDKGVAEAQARAAAIKKCFAAQSSLRNDYETKRKELMAQFGGKIPAAYDNVVLTKRRRASRANGKCLEMNQELGGLMSELDSLARSLEPRNLPANVQRRQRFQELMKSTSELVRKSGPRSPREE